MSREDDAKRILEDPLFQDAFKELKEQMVAAWLNTAPKEVEQREYLHLSIKIADRLYSHFESILETGQIAQIYDNHTFT